MHGVEEKLAFQGDALLGLTGDDLPIIWVVPFDELRDEQRAVDLERDLVVAYAHLYVALIADEAREFIDAFRRDDDVDFLAAGKLRFQIEECQPATISGDHGELVLLERKEDAVQHVTGFIRRNRIGGLAQTVAEFLLTQREDLRAVELWQQIG